VPGKILPAPDTQGPVLFDSDFGSPNHSKGFSEPIALVVRPHYNVVRFEVDQDFQTNFIDSIWQHDANDISPGA
jgi:hypothetical protein